MSNQTSNPVDNWNRLDRELMQDEQEDTVAELVGCGRMLVAEIERLRAALERYAKKEHLFLAEPRQWDIADEESPNFLCGTGSAHIEDGTWARYALARATVETDGGR